MYGTAVRSLPANEGDAGLIPGSENPLEKEMALQYSCLGNPMTRAAWQSIVHRVTKESDTT